MTLCNLLFNVDIKKTEVKVRDIETQEDGASNLIVKMSKKHIPFKRLEPR